MLSFHNMHSLVTYFFFVSWFLFSKGKIHPLTFIHHTWTYQASLCKLMEYWWGDMFFIVFHFGVKLWWLDVWCHCFRLSCSLSPAIYTLQARLKENEIQVIAWTLFFNNFGLHCTKELITLFFSTSWENQLAQLMEEAKSLKMEAPSISEHDINMNSRRQ